MTIRADEMNMNATPDEMLPPKAVDIRAEQYRDEFVSDDDYSAMLADAMNWGE